MKKEIKNGIRGQIFEQLSKSQFKYKGVPVNFFGLPTFCSSKPRTLVSNELSRMKRLGLIEKNGEFLQITNKGKDYIKRRQERLSVFYFTFQKSAPKNLIVMFDIPEGKKAEREWFRFHLRRFDYIMVQRSVWVGPSPLPKDFLKYIEEINLKDCIKTFKLAKGYKPQ
ncbi:MAG: hypothetical protein NT068_02725 [Candidatus Nomurabacteria bacterium]|nr:hypothetical protein [Candidatus Nomurabacteria bacterium]